jgi:hypothetical protein
MAVSQAKKWPVRNTVHKIQLHDQNCLQWGVMVFINKKKMPNISGTTKFRNLFWSRMKMYNNSMADL